MRGARKAAVVRAVAAGVPRLRCRNSVIEASVWPRSPLIPAPRSVIPRRWPFIGRAAADDRRVHEGHLAADSALGHPTAASPARTPARTAMLHVPGRGTRRPQAIWVTEDVVPESAPARRDLPRSGPITRVWATSGLDESAVTSNECRVSGCTGARRCCPLPGRRCGHGAQGTAWDAGLLDRAAPFSCARRVPIKTATKRLSMACRLGQRTSWFCDRAVKMRNQSMFPARDCNSP
jgi:hypothetical protein